MRSFLFSTPCSSLVFKLYHGFQICFHPHWLPLHRSLFPAFLPDTAPHLYITSYLYPVDYACCSNPALLYSFLNLKDSIFSHYPLHLKGCVLRWNTVQSALSQQDLSPQLLFQDTLNFDPETSSCCPTTEACSFLLLMGRSNQEG